MCTENPSNRGAIIAAVLERAYPGLAPHEALTHALVDMRHSCDLFRLEFHKLDANAQNSYTHEVYNFSLIDTTGEQERRRANVDQFGMEGAT